MSTSANILYAPANCLQLSSAQDSLQAFEESVLQSAAGDVGLSKRLVQVHKQWSAVQHNHPPALHSPDVVLFATALLVLLWLPYLINTHLNRP